MSMPINNAALIRVCREILEKIDMWEVEKGLLTGAVQRLADLDSQLHAPALRCQTEPPTEPVERCLVIWPRTETNPPMELMQKIAVVAGRSATMRVGSNIVTGWLDEFPPDTQYCPLPDIAEAE